MFGFHQIGALGKLAQNVKGTLIFLKECINNYKQYIPQNEFNISFANARKPGNSWEFCRSMRDKTNACVPRDVSRDKRGKFCKHLKGFKTKTNRMNKENFAAFFVLLAFIELSLTVTRVTGVTNSNKRETRALAKQKNGKALRSVLLILVRMDS